jgi:EpsI family protein
MIVIWAGHVTNMQHPYVQAHVNLGWYVFGAAFFLYFIILNRFAAKPVKDLPAKTESTISTAATIKPKKLISTGIAALSVIVLTPAIINPAALQGDTSNHPNIAQLDEIEGWSGPYPYSGQWAPAFNGAHGEKQVTFIKDGQAINVYIAYYLKQDQEQELINYDNKVINNNWMPYKYNSLKIDTTRNNTLRVQEIKSRSPQGSQVVWSWYYIAGSETADRRLAKFLELKKLVNNNKLSAIIAVSPDSGSDYPTARNAAEELLSSLHPQILTVFEGI